VRLLTNVCGHPASSARSGRLNPQLSPKLQDIILKCLEKNPENRYQLAKELGVDLRADLKRLKRDTDSSHAAALSGVAAAARARPWWRRRTALADSGVALAALLALGTCVCCLPRAGHRFGGGAAICQRQCRPCLQQRSAAAKPSQQRLKLPSAYCPACTCHSCGLCLAT